MFNKKELSQMSTLIRDASANRVAMFSDVNSAKHADDAIRKFHEEILGGELNWQSWRFHKNEIFTVWENVLKPELPEAWKTSPFYKRVCEVKNGLLGDKNSFAVRDKSYLAAAKFLVEHGMLNIRKLDELKISQLKQSGHLLDVMKN